MTLQKHRAHLVAAREEIDRTLAALDVVETYLGVAPRETTGPKLSANGKRKRIGRPPKKKRHMSPEGEARRLAGLRAGLRAWHKKRYGTKPEKRRTRNGRVPHGFWNDILPKALAAGATTPKALLEYVTAQGHKVTKKSAAGALERYRRGKL